MAFADGGNLGAGGNTNPNQATLTVVTALALAAGDLAVVALAVDNRLATGGDNNNETSGVALDGLAMLKARQHATTLAAQAGVATSLWYLNCQRAVASGSNIVATFTDANSEDATALSSRKFTKAAGMDAVLQGTAVGTSTTTAPGSLDVTTENAEMLRIRIAGCEYDATQALTVTASWTAWTEAASNPTGTAGETVVEAEHRIVTGTNGASAPTLGTACDSASVYAAFKEVLSAQNKDSMFMVI